MSFFTLILKNLLRRRSRSLLTVAGIAIGIGAVVALTALAWGFERSWVNAYKARGTDMIVTKTSTRSAMPAPFSAGLAADLRKLPRVREVSGVLSDIFSVEDSPSIIVFGWEPKSFLWTHLKLVSGAWPDANSENVAALGIISAEMLRKKIGDKVQLETSEYTVCAIYTSSALAENGAIILPLAELQKLMDRQDMVNFMNLRCESGTTEAQLDELRMLIKSNFKGLMAFSPGEVAQSNSAIQIAKAMSLATSLIALLVGAVGIMNTVLMSVFERLQEIGVLLAIGWRRARILQMILFESLLLSFAGGIGGICLGIVAVKILETTPWIRGKIESDVTPSLLLVALLIALALGTLGGLYPAWLGSRMSPVNALHHE
jgi:putative ABC transport system permease protein